MTYPQQNTNTWKSWIDWWPTYIIIGISLAHFTNQTGIVQKLTNQLFTKKDTKKDSTESETEY